MASFSFSEDWRKPSSPSLRVSINPFNVERISSVLFAICVNLSEVDPGCFAGHGLRGRCAANVVVRTNAGRFGFSAEQEGERHFGRSVRKLDLYETAMVLPLART